VSELAIRAPIFRGKVDKGRLILDNRDKFRRYLASFEGKTFELILRERQPWRSEEQNRYYFGVVVAMVSEHTGHTPEESHQILKDQFKVETTTKMKTVEFQEYVENCRRYAAETLGLPIPDPGQIDY